MAVLVMGNDHLHTRGRGEFKIYHYTCINLLTGTRRHSGVSSYVPNEEAPQVPEMVSQHSYAVLYVLTMLVFTDSSTNSETSGTQPVQFIGD